MSYVNRIVASLATTRCCSTEDPDQCVGYVEMDLPSFKKSLGAMGFEETAAGTWRKCDEDWQLHVLLYGEGERTYIYAHWEHNWDKEPLACLRGENFSVTKGVNEMRRELTMADIEWLNDNPYE